MKRVLLPAIILIALLSVTGCSSSTHESNNTSIGQNITTSLRVPNDSDVKSMTVSVSILPSATKKIYTNENDKATIERILTWLKNSKEVGLEKPPIGKGGYPPTLQIVLETGNTMVIGPAVNWSSKKLANGSTEISGTNVAGYVSMATTNGSKVVRLYSPELYKWIVNHEWE